MKWFLYMLAFAAFHWGLVLLGVLDSNYSVFGWTVVALVYLWMFGFVPYYYERQSRKEAKEYWDKWMNAPRNKADRDPTARPQEEARQRFGHSQVDKSLPENGLLRQRTEPPKTDRT